MSALTLRYMLIFREISPGGRGGLVRTTGLLFYPFRTTVPLWGHFTQILSSFRALFFENGTAVLKELSSKYTPGILHQKLGEEFFRGRLMREMGGAEFFFPLTPFLPVFSVCQG